MKQLITIFIRTLISFICSLFFDPPPPPPPLPTIPFDLIAEILCRLPVNLLLQLRCQSKTLNSLISDPEFAKKHLRMSTTKSLHFIPMESSDLDSIKVISYPLHSFFNPKTIKPTRLRCPIYQHDNSIIIKPTQLQSKEVSTVGSCNGILCLTIGERYSDKTVDILLWNPSLRKFKIFHAPKYSQEYNPTTRYGFGYDHVNNVYKVLSISFNNYLDLEDRILKSQVSIHTLGSDSWRRIRGELPLPTNRLLVFIGGALNWITYTDSKDDLCVASFDLVNESCRKLLQPNFGEEYVHGVNGVFLGVLRDSLCIIVEHRDFSSVWLMKEYGNEESWTELFRFHETDHCIRPLWIYEDDLVLMRRITEQHRNKNWTVYDFKNDTFKFPFKFSKIKMCDIPFTYEVCVESLISPCF